VESTDSDATEKLTNIARSKMGRPVLDQRTDFP